MSEFDEAIVEMLGVSVVNLAHNEYRRAGFVFQTGENTLPPVTYEQWQALSADPRLSVTVITADNSVPPPGTGSEPPPQLAVEGVATYIPTRDELLHGAVMASLVEPDIYYTKGGQPRMKAWQAVVDADLTADEIQAALKTEASA